MLLYILNSMIYNFLYLKISGSIFHEANFILSLLLILIGFYGMAFNKKNIIIVLLCIELILLGISFLFISFSLGNADPRGQVIALLMLPLAGAESVIGLSII